MWSNLKLQSTIAYYNSPLGILQIKSNGDAIEEITFANSWKGKKIDEDEIDLFQHGSPIIQKCIEQLKEYFSGTRKKFDFPVIQDGTEFQKKVWNELQNIPYGKPISYMELAKRIGNAKAIRAVGTCNGSNKICIVVPCHRVIGSNGDLVGYGGELWRKKWLLDHEAKYGNGVQTLF